MNPGRRLAAKGLAAGLALPATSLVGAQPPGHDAAIRWPALSLLDGSAWTPPRATDGRPHAVVAVIWSTTCPFCLRHNAHIDKLHRRAAGRSLSVVTAALDRDPDAVTTYLSRHGYGFPVVRESDRLRTLFTARRVIPFTGTVDRSGHVRDRVPGEMFEADVLGLLELAT
ncbi:MAG: TlpA family protein disulfide reductase [Ideonella sp.]|jgi:thiol-disulfide isomerase/thioredoxin|nr:TlpA family protein disulfide reductase [Ideonella sp.]